MKIIGFNGSPHKDGICSKLLENALKECEAKGANTENIKLIDLNLPFFHGRNEKTPPVGLEPLWEKIKEADGFIFATPVHWFNMSAPMKNFIDWFTTFESIGGYPLEGKVAGIITTCEEDGGQKTINDIVAPLMHQGIIFAPYVGVFFNKNMNQKSEDNWQNEDIKLLGKNMIKMIELLKSKKTDWGY